MTRSLPCQAAWLLTLWAAACTSGAPQDDGLGDTDVADTDVADTDVVDTDVVDTDVVDTQDTDAQDTDTSAPLAPLLVVASPLEGLVLADGQDLELSAMALDPDGSTTSIIATLMVDGTAVWLGHPAANGQLTISAATSGSGAHMWTLEVVDSDSLTASVTRGFRINGAPTAPALHIEPLSPHVGDALHVVFDTPSADPDGDPLTYTYAWFKDGVQQSTTAMIGAGTVRRDEVWTVTVHASDGRVASASSTAAVVTVLNSAPLIVSAEFAPAVPTSADVLSVANIAVADADGDTTSVSYAWTLDGVAASTSPSLDLSNVSRLQQIGVTLRATDGTTTSDAFQLFVNVANAAPVAAYVNLSPTAPITGEPIVATPAGQDADGDALTWTYTWTAGSTVVQQGPNDTYAGFRGDVVRVSAVAFDGADDSLPIDGGPVTVSNAPPLLTLDLQYAPPPRAGTRFDCSRVVIDPEGDPVTAGATQWYVDGSVFWSWGVPPQGQYADAPASWVGKSVSCAVRYTDSLGARSEFTYSQPVLVENTPPRLVDPTLSDPLYPGEAVRSLSAYDPDQDYTPASTAWYVDGVLVQTTTSGTWIVPRQQGSQVHAVVTMSDGAFPPVTETTNTITIGNTSPLASSPAIITPMSPVRSSVLTASFSASDRDGDPLVFTYVWLIDGVEVQSGTDATLHATLAPGQVVRVVATASDPFGGTVSSGQSVTVNNLVPAVAITFDPPHPYDNEDIVCVPQITDPEGDAIAAVTYTWKRGSTTWTGAVGDTYNAGDTIAAADAAVDEPWTCLVTATDAFGASGANLAVASQRGDLVVAVGTTVSIGASGGNRHVYYADLRVAGTLLLLGDVRIHADSVTITGTVNGAGGSGGLSGACRGITSTTDPSSSGAGGCGGGSGGNGSGPNSLGGVAPDAPANAGRLGSLGARGVAMASGTNNGGTGGHGGAGLSIYTDTLVHNGNIVLSGSDGGYAAYAGGGGGGGGLLLDVCASLTGTGIFTSRGGAGGNGGLQSGGGGGGGTLLVRTPFVVPSTPFASQLTGGSGLHAGAAGWTWLEVGACTEWR